MRKFYSVGFEPEHQIGKAVELETYDLAGFKPETIREAAKAGKSIPGFDHQTLSEGRKIGKLPSQIRLVVARTLADALDFDVVVNPLSWKIVSKRLGNALKEVAPDDVELLPVTITGLKGEKLREDFCVINVLQMLDAISEKKTVRSTVKWASGTHPVIRLAIVGSKVPRDVHVFRVKQCPWAFLVDDVAKQALNEQPHDGLAFIPIETE